MTSSPAARRGWSHLVTLSLAAVFVLHVLSVVYAAHLHHDTAQYLTAGQMLVAGDVPYVDFIDTNPPMIVYISAVPALFAHWTGVSLATSGLVFFFLVVLATLFLFVRVLRVVAPDLGADALRFVCVAWLFASLWTFWSGHFGQREQLLFLFLAPLLLLRHARHAGLAIPVPLVVCVALAACLGIAIKPFFLGLVVVFELAQMLRFRSVRPFLAAEIAICIAAGLLYALHFYLVPGMSSFYDYWLDYTLRGYAAYEHGWSGKKGLGRAVLSTPALVSGALALLLCVLFWGKKKDSLVYLASSFGLLAWGALALFILQAKGWRYQLLPFHLFAFLGVALALVSMRSPGRERRLAPLFAVLSMLLVWVGHTNPVHMLSVVGARPAFAFPESVFTRQIERHTEPDDRVLILNTSLLPGFPSLTYTGRRHGGRFLCTYPLAFFFHDSEGYVPDAEWLDEEALFYEWLLEDIETLQPKLILVNGKTELQGTAPYFSVAEYLKRKGFGETLAGYTKLETVKGFELYLRD